MNRWLRRVRGALGMGLTWAVGWVVAGVLFALTSFVLPGPFEAFTSVFDAPMPALAIPGFIGGALFSVVLGIAARRRTFDELSIPRFVAWGAVGGMLLTLVPAAMVAVGLASASGSSRSLWQSTALICGPLILLSTLSAAGTLLLARRATGRRTLNPTANASEAGLSPADAGGLLGSGDWSSRTLRAARDAETARGDAARGSTER